MLTPEDSLAVGRRQDRLRQRPKDHLEWRVKRASISSETSSTEHCGSIATTTLTQRTNQQSCSDSVPQDKCYCSLGCAGQWKCPSTCITTTATASTSTNTYHIHGQLSLSPATAAPMDRISISLAPTNSPQSSQSSFSEVMSHSPSCTSTGQMCSAVQFRCTAAAVDDDEDDDAVVLRHEHHQPSLHQQHQQQQHHQWCEVSSLVSATVTDHPTPKSPPVSLFREQHHRASLERAGRLPVASRPPPKSSEKHDVFDRSSGAVSSPPNCTTETTQCQLNQSYVTINRAISTSASSQSASVAVALPCQCHRVHTSAPRSSSPWWRHCGQLCSGRSGESALLPLTRWLICSVSVLVLSLLALTNQLTHHTMWITKVDQERRSPARRSRPSPLLRTSPNQVLCMVMLLLCGLCTPHPVQSSSSQLSSSPLCITSDCLNHRAHHSNLDSSSHRSLQKRSSDFLNLHRHHHPSHPHYHGHSHHSQSSHSVSQPYNQLYAMAAASQSSIHYIQSEQPFGLRPNRALPSGLSPPLVSSSTTKAPDRSVRRISDPVNSGSNLRQPYNSLYSPRYHSITYQQHQQQSTGVESSSNGHKSSHPSTYNHHTTPPTHRNQPTTTNHQVKSEQQPQQSTPLHTCPDGPPSQWDNQLDVAAKAYLAPVVFYGQLISLGEDYKDRFAATFRLLQLVKPPSASSNHSSASTLSAMLTPSADTEKHIKLYFRNRTTSGTDPEYCELYMPNIRERLLLKERYILFAHEQILSTRYISVPSMTNHHQSPYHHSAPAPSKSVQPSRNHSHQHHANHQHHSTPIGHQLISLVTYALPEVQNKTNRRLVRKVLCKACAKPANVHSSGGKFEVMARGNITLACRVDGNPLPWIEWYRNGKKLRPRPGKRVTIKQKKRVSHLTIVRASYRRDRGLYECRAMNVVSKVPAVKRIEVHVFKSASSFAAASSSPSSGSPSSSNGRRTKPSSTSASSSFSSSSSSISPSSSSSTSSTTPKPNLEPNSGPTSTSNSNTNEDTSESSAEQTLIDLRNSQARPGWFLAQPCPISSYCLNGGSCSLYETVGEYVCQCSDGFRGQRCEFKDVRKSPAQKALLDYDLSTRMLHSYMSSKVSEDDV